MDFALTYCNLGGEGGGGRELPALTHNCHVLFTPLPPSHAKGHFICTYMVAPFHVTKFYLHPDLHPPKNCASPCRPYKWVQSCSTREWRGPVYQELGPEWRAGLYVDVSPGLTDPLLCGWGWSHTKGRTESYRMFSPGLGPLLPITLWYYGLQ